MSGNTDLVQRSGAAPTWPDEQDGEFPARDTDPSSLEAWQRSPTLMAGQAAGSQGLVRVWAPDGHIIRRQMVRCGAPLPFLILGLAMSPAYYNLVMQWLTAYALHAIPQASAGPSALLCALLFSLPHVLLGALVCCVIGSAAGALSWRRPPYLTTDDAGLGITTWRGCRSLRWEEVVACACDRGHRGIHGLFLYTGPFQRIPLNLLGYDRRAREELYSLIVDQAQLEPAPTGRMSRGIFPEWQLRPGYRRVAGITGVQHETWGANTK